MHMQAEILGIVPALGQSSILACFVFLLYITVKNEGFLKENFDLLMHHYYTLAPPQQYIS